MLSKNIVRFKQNITHFDSQQVFLKAIKHVFIMDTVCGDTFLLLSFRESWGLAELCLSSQSARMDLMQRFYMDRTGRLIRKSQVADFEGQLVGGGRLDNGCVCVCCSTPACPCLLSQPNA